LDDNSSIPRVFLFEGLMETKSILDLFEKYVAINGRIFAEAGLKLVPIRYFGDGFTTIPLLDCVDESVRILKYYQPTASDYYIGHSAGGLIVRYLVEILGYKLKRGLLIECPNGGTNWLIERASNLNSSNRFITSMRKGSEIMEALPVDRACKYPYVEMRGLTSLSPIVRGVAALGYGFTKLPNVPQVELPQIGHIELVTDERSVRTGISILKAETNAFSLAPILASES